MQMKFNGNRFVSILLVAVLMIFCGLLLFSAYYADLGFDPAYHATVAKNFAAGHGYVTSYDRIFPINPDITTGPVMLLFSSLFIALFGNAIWMPAIAAASLNVLLLISIYVCFANSLQQKKQLAYFFISLITFFFLFEFHWWSSLKGDFSAVLLSLLALLLLYRKEPDLKHIFLATFCLSLAVLTKLTMLFSLVGVFPFLIKHRRDSLRQVGAYALVFCCAIALVFLPWKLYEVFLLASLDNAENLERQLYAVSFFQEQGSGWFELSNSQSLLGTMTENWQRNSSLLSQFLQSRYGLNELALLTLIAVYLVTVVVFFRACSIANRYFLTALIAVWIAHLLWFFFISASWNAKYALLGLYYFFISFILMLSQFRYGFITPLILFFCFYPGSNIYSPMLKNILTFNLTESEYRDDAKSTQSFIENNLSGEGVTLAGCGWVFAPHVIEYLLPTVNNFSDCRRLIKESIAFDELFYLEQHKEVASLLATKKYASAEQHYIQFGQYHDYSFTYTWQKPLQFYLVVNHIYWNSSAYSYRYVDVLKACAQRKIFSKSYFSIFECDFASLKKYVPLNNTMYFLRHPNDFYFVHKPKPIKTD